MSYFLATRNFLRIFTIATNSENKVYKVLGQTKNKNVQFGAKMIFSNYSPLLPLFMYSTLSLYKASKIFLEWIPRKSFKFSFWSGFQEKFQIFHSEFLSRETDYCYCNYDILEKIEMNFHFH